MTKKWDGAPAILAGRTVAIVVAEEAAVAGLIATKANQDKHANPVASRSANQHADMARTVFGLVELEEAVYRVVVAVAHRVVEVTAVAEVTVVAVMVAEEATDEARLQKCGRYSALVIGTRALFYCRYVNSILRALPIDNAL